MQLQQNQEQKQNKQDQDQQQNHQDPHNQKSHQENKQQMQQHKNQSQLNHMMLLKNSLNKSKVQSLLLEVFWLLILLEVNQPLLIHPFLLLEVVLF